MNKLRSDNVVFNRGSRAEEAFHKLKAQLASEPVLAFPRLGSPFIAEGNGNDYAVGGVLSQKADMVSCTLFHIIRQH